MTTEQPEALRREYRATMPPEVLHLWAADALACIASLEAQLEAVGAGGVGPLIASAGFDAADMATAAAQGFRDGVASVSAGSEPVAWREHVEQRLLTWRQSFVNRSGDQLALDDFMDKQSLDDLIDFVCDEWALSTHPSPPEGMVAAKEQQAGAFQAALDIRTAQGWKLGGDKVPVLYTDEINGQQVCRDDVWLCTTEAIKGGQHGTE